jgi:hypothetical protein
MPAAKSVFMRKAYTRKAFTRADGTRVKAVRVKSAPIKARGAQRGKQVIPPGSLKKNKLRKYGYSTHKPAPERHSAIRKASRKYGTLSTMRKLNAIRVLQKRGNPALYKKLNSDFHYAQKLHNSAKTTGGKPKKARRTKKSTKK